MADKTIRAFGQCDLYEMHPAHVDDIGPCLQLCPGQYADCRNCDDRKCMGCVFREYDHDCADDCPDCCGGAA